MAPPPWPGSSRAATRQPRGWRGPQVSSPPNAPTRSRHPGQAAAGSAGHAGAADAVVLDFDADLAGGEPQPDGRAGARARVLHRVRQGFLDEPEDDQLDAGGRVPRRTAALVPDRQAGRPDPGEQALQVGQAGERLPEFQPAVGPQDAEQAAGLGERLPGGARHAPDRLAGLGRRAGDRGQGTVGQRHDDGEVVRHAVVHLAGDAGPLHRRGQRAGLVVFAFQPLGPVAQLGQVGPAGARVQARDQDAAIAMTS